MRKIKSIEIKGASFFSEPFKIEFSDKLNCLMGGRGTGKSTILHFIKSCLEPNAEEYKLTFDVLRSNLQNGKVILEIETELGTTYEVHKTLSEAPQPYSNGQFYPVENILGEITCDIFPAQEIEEIGKNRDERLKLIDRMLRNEVDRIRNAFELKRIDLEKNAKDIRSTNLTINQVEERLREYMNAEEDFESFGTDQPEDINEAERKEFDKQDAAEKVRRAEKSFLDKLTELLNTDIENIQNANADLKRTVTFLGRASDFINKQILDSFVDETSKLVETIQSNNITTISQISNLIAKSQEISKTLKDTHAQQHNEFVQLKQKLDKHKAFYDKLNILSKRVDEKKILQNDLKDLSEKKKKLKNERIFAVKALNELKKELYQNRYDKVNELNQLFDSSRIRIILTAGGITDSFEEALRRALKGHNLRYNTLIPLIAENFSPDEFATIVHDRNLDQLREISGIDSERANTIINALYESESIYDIETIYCPDLPDFYLKVEKEGDHEHQSVELYKKSDELSTGQRCTTVLPIVFAISNNPLIIDQPEDNLDNKYISDTIRRIVKAQKGNRQLIFITHNPNIPVLSDAENNLFLTYDDMQAHILISGNVNEVKTEILNLLEGGEKAFQEREKLYHSEVEG